MASVVFSGNFGDEEVLKHLRDSLTHCCTVEAWTGLEDEVARLRENGVRIGSLLQTPPGYSKQELSFSFQCWDICLNDLREVARALFDRPLCIDLRAVGLN